MTGDEADPTGLIREAYRIEGITPADCRTIFLDWALGAPADMRAPLETLLMLYGADAPEHPMTDVLRAALASPPAPRRRGGYAGRRKA
ncbi:MULTISPECIES: hypothetical protein [Actibacterium]|uniref:Uncharacterized protein n=1 Tax=Actibacterium naphthalenivorans TaxID=1614693 RepID=A0A840CFG9_9RHOB|nr:MULTISPECIES: hypothetical protein [Actibacterium]ALG90532.1 hypothetical protein TQ29_10440 [Actibacterium sp. EMB200-NS6]MBB4023563.1 hypothetical protein [Actibacterium naphthalenivorans]